MILRMLIATTAIAAGQAFAQEDIESAYQGDRFAVTVEEIAEGVHVMRRDPSWRLPVQANTTLIVNESDAVLIDGGFGAHARNVIEEVRRITDNPVSVIINTHWHGDHNVGHYVFKQAWPGARIVAHEETRRLMVEENAMDYVANTGAIEDDDNLTAPRVERAAELREAGAAPEQIAYVEDSIAGIIEVRDDYAQWEMVPADETFAERMTLHRDEREIEILHFGVANTPGDAIIWLPGERIVFTGDTVVRPTPYGFGSRPASWANVLRDIKALDYEILVPGHGDLQTDTAYVDLLIRTMETITAGACAAVAEHGDETDEDAVYEAIDWESVEPEFVGDNALFARLFEIWFKRPISSGALAEINEDGTHACR